MAITPLPTACPADEDTRLLSTTTTTTTSGARTVPVGSFGWRKRGILLLLGSFLLVLGGLAISTGPWNGSFFTKDISMLGKRKSKGKKKYNEIKDDDSINDNNGQTTNDYPKAEKRCEWVIAQFQQHDAGKSKEELRVQYAAQDGDPNIFYRATAHIFWRDFKEKGWGNFLTAALDKVSLTGGVPVVHKNTWTWVTGDQHLSNFGAWQNRAGEVVFGGTYIPIKPL